MNLKILFLEDDLTLEPLWRSWVRRFSPGAEIFWAVSSEEGKTMVEQANLSGQPFQIIVADIFLAGSQTGIDFLTSDLIRSSNARTVLVSMVCSQKVESYYRSLLPTTLFISKPINLVKCEKLVSSFLNNEWRPGEISPV